MREYFMPAVIALCLVLASFAVIFYEQRNTAFAQRDLYKNQTMHLQSLNDQCAIDVTRQNAAIDDFKKYIAAHEEAAKTALTKADIAAKPLEKKAALIAAIRITDNECNDLKAIIDEARK